MLIRVKYYSSANLGVSLWHNSSSSKQQGVGIYRINLGRIFEIKGVPGVSIPPGISRPLWQKLTQQPKGVSNNHKTMI